MIPYKSQLKGTVAQKNKQFKELSTPDQKREIALDGLKLIIKNKISPAGREGMSHYWGSSGLRDHRQHARNSKDFQKRLLTELPEACEVCERGLIMLSKIRVANTIDPCGDAHNISSGSNGLQKPFTFDEMEDMETVYENGSTITYPYQNNTLKNMANNLCVIIDKGKFLLSVAKEDYVKKWKLNIIDEY